MNRTIGRFFLPNDFVRSENAQDLFEAMRFVPLRTELRAYSMEFDYIGSSYLFHNLQEGSQIPIYEIIVDYDMEDLDENEKPKILVSVKINEEHSKYFEKINE